MKVSPDHLNFSESIESKITHIYKARMCSPTIKNTPLDIFEGRSLFDATHHLVEARSRGAARVLRVLSEEDDSLYAISFELVETHFGIGLGVTEGDVGFVRGGLGTELVKECSHSSALVFGPLEDW